MGDSDISDGHGYDSDRDKEYIPHQKKSKNIVRVKIRGRYIPIPTSSPRSSSDSDSDNSNSSPKIDFKRRSQPSCSSKKYIKHDKIGMLESKSNKFTEEPQTILKNGDSTILLETDSNRSKPSCYLTPELKATTEKEEAYRSLEIIENETRQDVTATREDRIEESQDNTLSEQTEKKLTRKRKNNSAEWACNIRKTRFDQGLEYISSRKKVVPAKQIKNKKDCVQKCLYQCSRKISNEQRNEIFKNYYSLSAVEKKHYILNSTEVDIPYRRRKGKNSNNSKKGRTFRYYFTLNGRKVQVCKMFYTGTLCISQKPIYTVHKNKTSTNTLPDSTQGKHKKRVTSPEDTDFVKEHINMIPRVKSHYCRKASNKEYLESDMNITKLYEMYLEYANDKQKSPVSFCVYRKIFCNCFNIAFHKPRKDRCDTCEEMKMKKKENKLDEEAEKAYLNHLNEKEYMRKEKEKDKESGKPILCFDLENVLTCPKADIKNFFYKSKLNVYNMTAHLSIGKQVYCAVWTEALHGRTGNDMASAVYKILHKVLEDHPEFTEIILWSDSCVPQNRNSLMSYALTHLIQTHKNLQKITMKFSVPGHSCIQEVDAIHSTIERSLNKVEYYSPVSLIRFLIKVNRHKPYTIIQMKKQDFIDFQFYSNQLNYNTVPFSKVVCLQFSRSFFQLKYKDSFKPEDESNSFKIVNLHQRNLRRAHVTAETEPPIPLELKKCDSSVALPQTKVDAIKSMFKWIPEMDRQYYDAIFKEK